MKEAVLANDRSQADPDHDVRERRIALLLQRLPLRVQNAVQWLRRPAARWVRIPVAALFILGGFLFILPVFGLWMLPVGLILLSEDIAPLRRLSDRCLSWIERRRPHWMGLPRAAEHPSGHDGKKDR